MIILIRHATPNIDYSRCTYHQAVERLQEYNQTISLVLSEINGMREKLKGIVDLNNANIYSSPLPRASSTAKSLFPEFNIKFDQIFIEFDLSIFHIPFLKFNVRTWFFISRILWFIGLNKAKKNFFEERLRVLKCIELLEVNTNSANIILVAHGMLNKFIEMSLVKNGWHPVLKIKSNGCLNIKILKRD